MTARQKNRLLAGVFFFWLSVYTYPSFLSSYCQDTLLASAVMVGAITGSYGLLQLICRVPLGILSDRTHRRKRYVLIGLAASCVASAGFLAMSLLAPAGAKWAATVALICRALSGVTASAWVTLSVMYTSAGEDTNAAMSRLMLPMYASQMLGMLSGAILCDRVGAWAAFALALAAGIVGILILSAVPESDFSSSRLTVKGFLDVARDKDLIAGTALGTLLHFVTWATVLGFVQNWARDVLQLDTSFLGWLQLINLLPTAILSRLSGGVIAGRIGLRATWVGGFLILAAACCLFAVTRTALSLSLVQALFGVGAGLIYPLTMASAIRNIPDEKRGLAMGLYQAIYGAGMFLGPVVAGAIISAAGSGSAGYQVNFIVAGCVALLGAGWAAYLSRSKREA